MNSDTMVAIGDIADSDLEHKDELSTLAVRATNYLESMPWCEHIKAGMLDRGWGYILAIFYFTFEPSFANIPSHTWIIVGDLPPAYIDADSNPNGACALDGYVAEMEKWIEAVFSSRSVDGLIPVNAPHTLEYAEMLKGRLDLIKDVVLSELQDEIKECL